MKHKIEIRSKTQDSIDDIIFSPEQDLVVNAYEESRPGDFVLVRTFKSGIDNGVATELSYLENMPGYIFCNPTTVISKSIPSKTISQLPGNDWSGQPSFIFTIQSRLQTTIANQGIASLNSFSSTEAMSIMRCFDNLAGRVNEPLTLYQKMHQLQDFLTLHWQDNIDSLKNKLVKLEGKIQLSSTKQSPRKFAKPFEYFFHSTEEYNSLLSSLEKLHNALERANNLTLVTRDVVLKPHPVAQIIHAREHTEALPDHDSLSHEFTNIQGNALVYNFADKMNKMKSILFRAVGSIKSSEMIKDHEVSKERGTDTSPESKDKRKAKIGEESSIYDNYCNYLDTGARHNELVSRVYPWEISGIEWGEDKSTKINAISDLIVTINKKRELYFQFVDRGITHPLFIDFMLNKLSLQHPDCSCQELKKLLSDPDMAEAQMQILAQIKLELQNPVCIYEYSPVKRELINISAIVADYRNILTTADKGDLSFVHELAEQYNLLFEEGFQAHIDQVQKLNSGDLDNETRSLSQKLS